MNDTNEDDFKVFVADEFEYDRIATQEELEGLSNEEIKALSKEARVSPVVVKPDTFEPMVVINRVAYILEPCNDLN